MNSSLKKTILRGLMATQDFSSGGIFFLA